MVTVIPILDTIPPELYILVGVVITIVLILKGCALYRAARKESKGWFWVLMIFNTMGILPLLYLIFSKKDSQQVGYGKE